MFKKLAVSSYIILFAVIASVVGIVGLLVSHGVANAYALKNIGLVVTLSIIGTLLCLVASFVPLKFGNHDFVSTISIVGAVALFMVCFGMMVEPRILDIGGLFSYNSQNALGWSMFTGIIVGAIGYILACLALIVAAFMPSKKKAQ